MLCGGGVVLGLNPALLEVVPIHQSAIIFEHLQVWPPPIKIQNFNNINYFIETSTKGLARWC